MPDTARILVVDDEAVLMKALCDTLRDHSYETTGFTVCADAMAALKETKFDLLLADLMMPEMDGITLLRAALEIDPDLVGVIMTGQGTIDTAVEAMKTGALDYVLKPFKLSAVLPVLSRALTVRRLRLENAELQRRERLHASELEDVNKELEAFSYSISHDLRAPLRHVDGFTNILLQKFSSELPEEAQRLLNSVSGAAQRMGRLIDDLLRFSRLSRQPLLSKHVNLSSLVQQVLEELRNEQPDRRVEIRSGELPDCVGDASLLRQVLVNLLSNAFKFTRLKQEAIVEVGCNSQESERVYFVRDNGAGFDMKYAEKLFGVFQRMHREDQFEGTGVGLSIVNRIILRHGGRIWAEAEIDKGATFYFTLPG